jgi:predicted  nucleic acid-binding Zn-ribbon protein
LLRFEREEFDKQTLALKRAAYNKAEARFKR